MQILGPEKTTNEQPPENICKIDWETMDSKSLFMVSWILCFPSNVGLTATVKTMLLGTNQIKHCPIEI